MKLLKNISTLILFLFFFSGAIAQPTCALRLIDGTPSSPTDYSADIALFSNYTGTLVQIGSTYNYTPLTPNATNYLSLYWNLPIPAIDPNCLILVVRIYESGTPSNLFYSAWFNVNYYYNYNINVTASI